MTRYVEGLPACINCGGTVVNEPCADHWYSYGDRLTAAVEELEGRLAALELGRPSPVYDGGPPQRGRKVRRKGGTPGI